MIFDKSRLISSVKKKRNKKWNSSIKNLYFWILAFYFLFSTNIKLNEYYNNNFLFSYYWKKYCWNLYKRIKKIEKYIIIDDCYVNH